jgi:exodeoxyribonuclease VII small subunit
MNNSKTYQEKVDRLEEIQEIMKNPETSLEDNMKFHDEASELITDCRNYLEKAELKVSKVLGDDEVDFQE